MSIPGMIDLSQARKPRRSMRSRFITKMFTVGILATMVGGGTTIVQNIEADAATQAQINRYIRSEHGIPPCKWEDGSGTPGVPEKAACYWNDGSGWAFIAVADGRDKDDDKDIVYLTGPKAVRY